MQTEDKTSQVPFGQVPFGRRNEPHRIIIARGEKVSSFTIRPWLAGVSLSFVFLLITVYLGATAYLVFRDRLIETANESRSQVRTTYEDRIADLRAQNDRITSRQLIDRKSYEDKLKRLLARQNDLNQRQSRIAAIIERASKGGLRLTLDTPLPEAKPQLTTIDAVSPQDGVGGETMLLSSGTGPLGLRGSVESVQRGIPAPERQPVTLKNVDDGVKAMDKVSSTLGLMDQQASAVLDAIAVSAERRISHIETVAEPLGVALTGSGDALGGPYVPLASNSFETRVERADRAINRLGVLRRAISTLPLSRPVPRGRIASRFGHRLDPFLSRPAMHTGIDFKAEYGTAVRATAAGTVVSAGRNGGYGLMVEVDHGNEITTRYAHLSRIRVAKGTKIAAGKIIGSVGSSGRSTGPHLHYETRLHGAPRDPATFLDAGRRLTASLK